MGEITRLSIQDVLERVENDYYENKVERPKKPEGYKITNYVYDENQTVVWNRNHQAELAQKYEKELTEYTTALNSKQKEFQYDVLKALSDEYHVNAEQARIIFSKAYDIMHSEGLTAVTFEAQELTEFYLDLRKEEME